MGVRFDWQIDEEADQEGGGSGRRPPSRWLRAGLVALLLGVIVFGAGWGWGEWRIRQARRAELAVLQGVLDRQTAAFLAGDGDAFFADAPPDPAWQAEQLKPLNLSFWGGAPTIDGFERVDGEIWANVTWTDETGVARQRVLFFEDRGDGPRLLDRSQRFWGEVRQFKEGWGTLRMAAADEPWRSEITRLVTLVTDELCAERVCHPLTVAISDRDIRTASETQIVMLSPRLWGLDSTGQPDARYWTTLENRLRRQLTPDPIVFAVPNAYLRAYTDLALTYELIFSTGRKIEIIPLESLPVDPAVMLSQVDGAALTPTKELIAAGLVFDLTDLIATDLTFDQEDYYEQIWQGARWRERMWFVPQTGRPSVIYYDREIYRELELPEPQTGWTWEEMWRGARVVAATPQFTWGMVTIDRDLLFSLAYNAGNSCADRVTVFCSPQLRPQDVAAAYAAYLAEQELMPDMTALTRREKLNYFQTQISVSTRKTPLWIDEPIMYELHFLSRAAGVAPFPGSAEFQGVTPLYIEGNMISGLTDRPLAVWHWLKFLSYQYIERRTRQIPGRPSVAAAQQYWGTLPRELGRTMQEAFPYSRPILLSESDYFGDEVLSRVLTGELTPQQAAEIRAKIDWFGRP